MKNGRDRALDGVRGIAAMAVVLSHVAAMTWVPFEDRTAPEAWQWLLWNLGAPAVDVFLVLSGYVVTRSLLRHGTQIVDYALSRMVRLYPLAWIAVCIGLLLRHADLMTISGVSNALNELHKPLGRPDVLGLMTMVAPVPEVNRINAPLWTLVVEMQAVLLMPLLAAIGRRNPLAVALMGMFIPLALTFAFRNYYPIAFTGIFVGAALAAAEDRIPQAPRPGAVLAFGMAVLLCRHYLSSDDSLLRVPCAFAAACVILSIRQGALRKALQTRIAQWLGSVSYPLYAVHWPLMAASALTLGRSVGVPIAAAASIPAALVLAIALERLVDRPAIALSRVLRGR